MTPGSPDPDGGRDPGPDGARSVEWYPEPEPAAAVAAVTAGFAAAFGTAPAGVWAAPGRVNLIGEHVDYSGGLCLPFALPQRTLVALAPRDGGRVRLRSAQAQDADWSGLLDDVGPGRVQGWPGYVVGVAWALRAQGFAVDGFDAYVDGSVPLGAGLSSSAAVECATAIALDDVAGLGLGSGEAGRARLASACVRAENEIAGAPTGGMDQTVALRGRAGHALLLDCADFSAEPVPFDLAAYGLELLVMDTRAHHTLTDGRYGGRRDECALAARLLGVGVLGEVTRPGLAAALDRLDERADDADQAHLLRRRLRHVVTEIERVALAAQLLREGRPGDLGPLLDASHASLRDDYEVSCPELDTACAAALGAGALGARMTGGGFGGSAIALVHAGTARSVAAAVDAAAARAGHPRPAFLRALPAGGATRLHAGATPARP